ncbi:MAG: hypothetical protein RLZZ08_1479 [Pseudomonadota bacterium]
MNKSKLLAGVALIAGIVPVFFANPAMAAGTAAGTLINNNVTVGYQVSGIAQTDATATNTVTVDRKVNLTVARTDNTATSVTPGAVNQAVSFTITNTSNDTLDFALSALQISTGAAAGISGNDTFNVTAPLTYYLDNGDGVFTAADTLITHLNSLAPDVPVTVHVVAAGVPTGLATNDIASVALTVTAKANDNGTALGSNLTQASTNTAGVDTIFADAAGVSDAARDAAFSAQDDFKVLAAALTAAKTSKIVAGDFGTGAAIPGATVEYCIAVTNAAGGAGATAITISDTLPAQVTYVSAYGVKVGGADCNTPGAGAGSIAGNIVSGTIASLAAGTSQTLIFRATIN